MEFVKTERGCKKLRFEGYDYIIDKTRESTTYWRCASRGICNARITMINLIISRPSLGHSHPPTPIENRASKVKKAVKHIAAQSEQLPGSIIDNVTSNIPSTIVGALPKEDSLKRTLRRKRPVFDSRMIGGCFAQIHQSTTLFPQRVSKPRTTVNFNLDNEHFNLNSNCVTSEKHSRKHNEKKQFPLEVQEAIVKTETTDVICENTNSKGVYDSLTTPNDKGFTETEVVTCFVCRKEILKDLMSQHLLIGQVRCTSCSFIFKSCKSFQKLTAEMNFGIDICDHVLEYLSDPWETLKLCYSRNPISSSSVTERIESKVNEYLNQIESLKNRYPWKEIFSNSLKPASKPSKLSSVNTSIVSRSSENHVLESDRKYRSFSGESTFQDKSYVMVGFDKLPEINSNINPITYSGDHTPKVKEYEEKENNLVIAKSSGSKNSGAPLEKQYHCTKQTANNMLKVKKRGANFHHGESKRRVNDSENKKFKKLVEMPSDGFYYIVKHSVKECPNCYTVFKPQDFSVNIVTFLMTAICSDCGLTVYIVQDQTDGEHPTVCIVTDKESVINVP
ncbi:uncharacterized protein [Palaemon carinicauda]|uniref:uncharacterized protein n=1 Tax=Palaemon carinicauda TaxID=392227 RepID=UPI0035B5B63C